MAANVCVDPNTLEVDEFGRLTVKHDCGLVEGAGGLTLPTMCVFDVDSDSSFGDVSVTGSVTQVTATVECEVTNPSTCRSMRLHIYREAYLEFLIGDDNELTVQFRKQQNDDPLTTNTTDIQGALATAATSGSQRRYAQRYQLSTYHTLAPGDTFTEQLNMIARVTAGTPNTDTDGNAITMHMNAFLI